MQVTVSRPGAFALSGSMRKLSELAFKAWVAVVLALLASSGCNAQQPSSVPGGSATSLAWLSRDQIYFTALGSELQLWRMSVDNGERERVALPVVSTCEWPTIFDLERFSERDLGIVAQCEGGHWAILSYDVISEELGSLFVGSVMLSHVAWRPDVRQGFVATHGQDCYGFGKFRSLREIERFAVSPLLGKQSWPLDDPLFRADNDRCLDLGQAGWPSLLPGKKGSEFVFLASPDVLMSGANRSHASAPGRPASPWGVYWWNQVDAAARRIVDGFIDPSDFVLSSDGRYAALTGSRAEGGPGVWLINLGSGSIEKIADGKLNSPSYSPDGKKLAVINSGAIRLIDL